MQHLREMVVKEHEDRPGVGKVQFIRQHQVVIISERNVFNHNHHVGDCKSCEYSIDGSRDHFLPCQDDDVEYVGDGSEQANRYGDVAMVEFGVLCDQGHIAFAVYVAEFVSFV